MLKLNKTSYKDDYKFIAEYPFYFSHFHENKNKKLNRYLKPKDGEIMLSICLDVKQYEDDFPKSMLIELCKAYVETYNKENYRQISEMFKITHMWKGDYIEITNLYFMLLNTYDDKAKADSDNDDIGDFSDDIGRK